LNPGKGCYSYQKAELGYVIERFTGSNSGSLVIQIRELKGTRSRSSIFRAKKCSASKSLNKNFYPMKNKLLIAFLFLSASASAQLIHVAGSRAIGLEAAM